jgi:hypothetical protein
MQQLSTLSMFHSNKATTTSSNRLENESGRQKERAVPMQDERMQAVLVSMSIQRCAKKLAKKGEVRDR